MDNVKCLLSVPADDINFKAALGYASMKELKEANETLELLFQAEHKVKTKLLAVDREVRRREKQNK